MKTIRNSIEKELLDKFGRKPTLTESIYKDVLQIPKKTFGKYLKNEIQPRVDELQRIAFWLGVNPKDLF